MSWLQDMASEWNFAIISDFCSLNFKNDVASFKRLHEDPSVGFKTETLGFCIVRSSIACRVVHQTARQQSGITSSLLIMLNHDCFNIVFCHFLSRHPGALLAGEAGSTLRTRMPLCPVFRPSATRILKSEDTSKQFDLL